jgi:hypothetical protein
MFRIAQSNQMAGLLIAFLAGALLLSACSPASPVVTPTQTPAATPTATRAPTVAASPRATSAPTAIPTTDDAPRLSLKAGSLTTGIQTERITTRSAGDNIPYWELLPAHSRLTLQGYPISDHLMRPQIFIYPLQDLAAVNEVAGKIAASLQTLLQSPQEIPNMPFLPLFNAAQVMHTHVQYLDFKNGIGLRYLTEFAQGIAPINNHELIYTYQGLTSDGKYYVAAVLPVGHPSLPADGTITGKEPPEFSGDFRAYVANLTRSLNQQAGNTFTPNLIQLDALMSSLEIQ